MALSVQEIVPAPVAMASLLVPWYLARRRSLWILLLVPVAATAIFLLSHFSQLATETLPSEAWESMWLVWLLSIVSYGVLAVIFVGFPWWGAKLDQQLTQRRAEGTD
ncbi:hypothetical protein [Gordonia araii]|uniref:hypothetical protein n=1 Tax=Gordonia araii TaxID=263909 RepID=UPI001110BADF|nr:hypothetical protein [Gordonia araii]NNG98648.1 hypothetical protein [Gordonia araii NBRC 100433]